MALSTLKAKLQAAKNATTPQNLYTWNRWLAIVHAVQGIVILLLSTTKLLPVQTNYLAQDPIATEVTKHSVLANATQHLFDINLAYLVAIIFFVAAIVHGLMATVYRQRYEADLKKGTNILHWYAYGLSGGLTLLAVAMLSGIADLSTLLALFALSVVAALTGLAMEVYNQGKSKPNWLVYAIGKGAGVVPWIIIVITLVASNNYGGGNIPTFVYWLVASMFLFFAGFAVNMYLQYKKRGPWKSYLYGERMYLLLTLAANTALAWQIFAGTLRP
jgi:hypothetical protein